VQFESARLTVDTSDEIGVMAATFDAMQDEIAASFAAFEQTRKHLRDLVGSIAAAAVMQLRDRAAANERLMTTLESRSAAVEEIWASSTRSPNKRICWRSMLPSKRRGRATGAGVSPWSQPKCASWRNARLRTLTKSPKSFQRFGVKRSKLLRRCARRMPKWKPASRWRPRPKRRSDRSK
jgi:hypothetical protein